MLMEISLKVYTKSRNINRDVMKPPSRAAQMHRHNTDTTRAWFLSSQSPKFARWGKIRTALWLYLTLFFFKYIYFY